MRRSDWLFLLLLATVVAAVAGGLYFSDSESERARRTAGTNPSATDGPQIGGAFALVDQNGVRVTEADLAGRWTLIYFGYTYCPDVCPITLSTITNAIQSLGTVGDKVTPWFITVDPKRDTVEELHAYAEHFHPRMRFLTGSEEEVAKAAAAYKVYRAIRAEAPNDPDYFVDHTSIVYLMGPDGKYVTSFTHTASVTDMAERLRQLL